MAISETAAVNQRPATETRVEIASRIASEVRNSSDGNKLTKVTSLMHAFRVQGSPTRFSEVRGALESQRIRMSSGWTVDSKPHIRRTGVIELSADQDEANKNGGRGPDSSIRVTMWNRHSVGPDCDLKAFAGVRTADDVLWFDVEPPETAQHDAVSTSARARKAALWPPRSRQPGQPVLEDDERLPERRSSDDLFEQRVLDVSEQLSPWCPGLEEEMVRDLLRQDVQPKVETYGDENDGVRGISVVAVIARELPGNEGDSDGVSEQLLFQVVEMIVGDGWIITCWHPSRVYTGTDEHRPRRSILREPFLSHVRHRWFNDDVGPGKPQKTSGDLGIYLARAFVDTYGASHRMMERWIEGWEVDFYRCLTGDQRAESLKEAAGEISNILAMTGEFRRRITAFEHARWTTTDKSWFPNVADRNSAEPDDSQAGQVGGLAKSLETASANLALLSGDIRADMDLLMLQTTAAQQESTERLQGYLAKVTGLVLVPTLVAGLFGANTRLPGGGSWMGFEIMLLLMLVSAVAVYLVIRKLGT